MRRTALTCLTLGIVAVAACGTRDGSPTSEHVIRSAEPIQGGTVDTGDPAVVGILINSSSGMSLCSGSLIGPNLVLSAHHCVANSGSTACSSNSFGTTYPAADFMVTTNYTAAATIFNGSGQFPTADGVTWWAVNKVSVPGNNICGQDMSALQLSSPISGVCPLIPNVDSAVTTGEGYTAIGFGITTPTGQKAGTRYKVTGMAVTCAANCSPGQDSATMEWEGGASSAKGTCEGDSGGPAVDAAGRVIGTVSRGPAGACNSTVYESVYGEAAWIKQVAAAAATAGGYTAAGWVTGGATSNPANGYCGGSSSSSSTSSTSTSTSSSTSSTSSSGGGSVPTTCTGADGYQGCCDGSGTLYYCTQGAAGSSTPKSAACPSGTVCGWNASKSYYDCIAPPGGADPSGTYPQYCGGGSTSSSSTSSSGSTSTSSSSSGGNACAGATPTGTPACDTCIDNSCCNELVACSNDQACVTCAQAGTDPTTCANAAYTAFLNCLGGTCASPCTASSSSSSSSGSSSSGASTSSSGSTSSGGTGGAASSSGIFGGGGQGTGGSAGTGATGAGNSGTGAGHVTGTGNTPGANSGCSVSSASSAPSKDPAAPLSLAGLLVGAALMVSRRRRG